MTGHNMGMRATCSRRECTVLIVLIAVLATGFTVGAFGGSPEGPGTRDPMVSAAQADEKNAIELPGRPIEEDEPAFWSDVDIYKAVEVHPGRSWSSNGASNRRMGGSRAFTRGCWPARSSVKRRRRRREELGAVTRDVPVGDPEVTGKPDASFRIGSRFRLASAPDPADPRGCRITLVEGTGPTRRVVLWWRVRMWNDRRPPVRQAGRTGGGAVA